MTDPFEVQGGNTYKPHQRTLVIEEFRRLQSVHGAVHADDLVLATGVPRRTVRKIMSDADGVDFVLAGGNEGYAIACSQSDAHTVTARLFSQSMQMMDRVRRRMNAQSKLTEGY